MSAGQARAVVANVARMQARSAAIRGAAVPDYAAARLIRATGLRCVDADEVIQ
jgi:hypothetical protein